MSSSISGGIVLFFSALFALIISNSPLSSSYFYCLEFNIFGMSTHKFVNEALMTLFFLYVGLELKREFLIGQLSNHSQRILPVLSAISGIIFPAIIFFIINYKNQYALHGWAIPVATDIAFALGVLSLLHKNIPSSLKIFLTALAVVDDLSAILIIAIFYTQQIYLIYLLISLIIISILFLFNLKGIIHSYLYIFFGFILWYCILKSGIDATISGVILAFSIPLNSKKPLLILWEKKLYHWVYFLIIPIFAFFNTGIVFYKIDFSMLFNSITIGIILSLFCGKQIGIFSVVYIGEKLNIFNRPSGASWMQIYGVSILCGYNVDLHYLKQVLKIHLWQPLQLTLLKFYLEEQD